MGMEKRGSARKALRSSRTAATGTISASRAIVTPRSGEPGSRNPSGLYESSVEPPLAAGDPLPDSVAVGVRRLANTAEAVAVAVGVPVRGGSESMERDEGPASRSRVRWALRPIKELNLEAATTWLEERKQPSVSRLPTSICHLWHPSAQAHDRPLRRQGATAPADRACC